VLDVQHRLSDAAAPPVPPSQPEVAGAAAAAASPRLPHTWAASTSPRHTRCTIAVEQGGCRTATGAEAGTTAAAVAGPSGHLLRAAATGTYSAATGAPARDDSTAVETSHSTQSEQQQQQQQPSKQDEQQQCSSGTLLSQQQHQQQQHLPLHDDQQQQYKSSSPLSEPQQQQQQQQHQPKLPQTLPYVQPAYNTSPPPAAANGVCGDVVVGQLSWWNIVQLNWRLCAAGFMTYCVTLSIFPGFLAGGQGGVWGLLHSLCHERDPGSGYQCTLSSISAAVLCCAVLCHAVPCCAVQCCASGSLRLCPACSHALCTAVAFGGLNACDTGMRRWV